MNSGINRTLAIMRKELLHIVRNKGTFFLTLVSPALLLIVLMYAFTVDIKETPVAVLDNDRSALSQRYVRGLLATGDVTMCGWASSYDDLERRLEWGEIKAAIIIPVGFEDDMHSGREASLQVLIDGTAPSSANHATAHVVGFTQNLAEEILREELERAGYGELQFQPIDLRIRTWYNPTLRALVGYAPALLAMVMGMPGILATMIAERIASVRITALDLSPDMVAVARARIKEKRLEDRIRCVTADVNDGAAMEGLGLFDLVYSSFSLHHWKTP